MSDIEIESEHRTQKAWGVGLGLLVVIPLFLWLSGIIKLYDSADYLVGFGDAGNRHSELASSLREAGVKKIEPSGDLGGNYEVFGLGYPLVVRVRSTTTADLMVQSPLFKIDLSDAQLQVLLHDPQGTPTKELSRMLTYILERIHGEVNRS